jgi:hypothetical protein
MAAHITRKNCEGFQEVPISIALGGTDDDMLWSDSKKNGDVRTDYEDGDTDTDW